MNMIIDAFAENSMLLVAVIVFLICVIIGFFGDRYLRNQSKIGKILGNDKQKKEVNNKENQKDEELVETNPTLITSQNVNGVPVGDNPVTLGSDTNMQPQIINDSVIPTGVDVNVVENSLPINDFVTSQETILEPTWQADIGNNLVSNPLDNSFQEMSEPIIPEIYPSENNPQDVLGAPVPFDGQIVSDENINNMF